MIQNYEDGTCGLWAMRAAMKCFGQTILIRQLALTYCKDVDRIIEEGVDECGIQKVLRKQGYTCTPSDEMRKDEFAVWLYRELQAGHPVIFNTCQGEHWVCITQLIDERHVIVIDSTATTPVAVWTWNRLRAENGHKWFYGISVRAMSDMYTPHLAYVQARLDSGKWVHRMV